jgi:hypothetical protein
LICFLAWGSQAALPGATAIQLRLYIVQINLYPRREAIYHTANSGTMTFTKGSEAKYFSDTIAHE